MQLLALSELNLRSLPRRIGSCLVIVIGIAGVVAVFISILSLALGFRNTITNTGQADRAVVTSRGTTEGFSSLSRDDVRAIAGATGVRSDAAGNQIASAEVVVLTAVSKKSNQADAFVTVRGIGPAAFLTRREFRLATGRMFKPGFHELLVGAAAQRQFSGLDIGDKVKLSDGDWTVVGSFSSAGNSHESTLLTDADTLLAAYKRNTFNSVTVLLDSPQSFDKFKAALGANPTLLVDTWREPEYFASMGRPLNRLLSLIAYVIGAIMAIGAVFAALNTLYSAVISRRTEIGTLRAVGFGGFAVVGSVLLEALLLALIGAAIGIAAVFVCFAGRTVSTVGDAVGYNPQLVYTLTISPMAVGLGVLLACGIGLLGGIFPGLWVARLSVAEALRSA
ncbi:MAG TPA: ABC transporter permease [Steroidobacteraceae bacterium]|jgi:putative ABC transport system permease protein